VTVVGDGPVTAWADPARVTQILANLLDNARRHGPADGASSSVVVADEGPGVPSEDRERVFDRLVRLDDARGRDAGGAGLGLSIARALARAHGGELIAEESSSGARFRLTLPTGPPEAAPPGDGQAAR
jgi:signal transduction histidine kinase